MSRQIVYYQTLQNQKQYQIWSPKGAAGLAAWYDASDPDTVAEETSGFVSQWNDKSGNDNHMVQGEGAAQPSTGNLTQNGLNLIRFDNQQMSNSDVFSSYDGSKYSFIYVVRPVNYNTYTNGRLFNIGGTNHRVYPCCSTTPTDGFRWTMTGLYGLTISADNYNVPGETLITSFKSSYATDTTRSLWKNGGDIKIDQVLTGGNNIGNSLQIGDYNGTTPTLIDTAVGELIVFGDLVSDVTRQRCEGYLAWKWGLVAALPADHPYKNTFPS